jgi:hypothetical protein
MTSNNFSSPGTGAVITIGTSAELEAEERCRGTSERSEIVVARTVSGGAP